VVGACFLGLGRALGETMAVTMLIGNSPRIDLSPFAVGDSIASVIANQLGNTAKDLHRAALVELGLVLFLLTAVINSLARLLIWRVGRPRAGRHSRVPLGAASAAPAARRPRAAQATDRVMTVVLAACFAVTIVSLALILGYVAYQGVSAVSLQFFTNLPIDTPPGLGHAALGSAMLVVLATVMAVPVGVLAAVYLAEYRGRLAGAVRFVGELLAGVPSVVVGIFAYTVLVLPLGFSGWAGAFALAVMMVPVAMRTTEEALRMVPSSLRAASYALGATRWQTVVRVTLPAARTAITTGVLLAASRIAGETAPLLLTAYNSNFWPSSPSERTPFLTYYIFTYSRSDDAVERQLAWAGALVLLVVVVFLSLGVRALTGRGPGRDGQAE
jgi:phosphate transport system permease protein